MHILIGLQERILGRGLLCHGPPLLILPFSKKEQNEWRQVTETCQAFLIVSVAFGKGGRMRGMQYASFHLPFSKMFLMYTIFP